MGGSAIVAEIEGHHRAIGFFLNDKWQLVADHRVFWTLSQYLRDDLGLSGTKVVCAEGDCGACTVLWARYDDPQPAMRSLNACIALVGQLDGCHIVTIEGLTADRSVSAVGRALALHHGSQCGFCTPGFVMSLSFLAERHKDATESQVKNYLTGNLCRCTGYQSIIDAAMSPKADITGQLAQTFLTKDRQEIWQIHKSRPINLVTKDGQFFAPLTLEQALGYKAAFGAEVTVWAGGTDLGVNLNKGRWRPQKVLSLHLLSKLFQVKVDPAKVELGAMVSIMRFEQCLPPSLGELKRLLHRFAAMQIKHAATLAGNIANGSPIGDSMPPLMVLGTYLKLQSSQGSRLVALDQFYLGYKKTALRADELLTQIVVPIPSKTSRLRCYKISKRRDLDISALSAAFLFDHQDDQISHARIAMGGVAAIPIRLPALEDLFVQKGWSRAAIEACQAALPHHIQPMSDHRGSAGYRLQVAGHLFSKLWLDGQGGPMQGTIS